MKIFKYKTKNKLKYEYEQLLSSQHRNFIASQHTIIRLQTKLIIHLEKGYPNPNKPLDDEQIKHMNDTLEKIKPTKPKLKPWEI